MHLIVDAGGRSHRARGRAARIVSPTDGGQALRILLIAIVAAACGNICSTRAQDFPSRPITMVVPLPAGSAFDLTARLVAEGMRVRLRQPVIVENLTGASGSVGTGRCARAAPDGYTLCFG